MQKKINTEVEVTTELLFQIDRYCILTAVSFALQSNFHSFHFPILSVNQTDLQGIRQASVKS